jgi:hypothetical protein
MVGDFFTTPDCSNPEVGAPLVTFGDRPPAGGAQR